MKGSPEFRRFAASFHQDILDIHESEAAAIADALSALSPSEQTSLKAFLESIATSTLSDGELLNLWNSSQADFMLVEPAQARPFYRLIIGSIQRH